MRNVAIAAALLLLCGAALADEQLQFNIVSPSPQPSAAVKLEPVENLNFQMVGVPPAAAQKSPWDDYTGVVLIRCKDCNNLRLFDASVKPVLIREGNWTFGPDASNTVHEIDIDKNAKWLKERWNVTKAATMLAVVNGKVIRRIDGREPTKEDSVWIQTGIDSLGRKLKTSPSEYRRQQQQRQQQTQWWNYRYTVPTLGKR